MAGREKLRNVRLDVRTPWSGPIRSTRRRFVVTAVCLSVSMHVATAILIVLLPRTFPTEPRSQEQGTVELLMVEQKGTQPNQSSNNKQVVVPPEKVAMPPSEDPEIAAPKDEVRSNETPAIASHTAPEPPTPEYDDKILPSMSEQAPSKAAKAGTTPIAKQVTAQPVRPRSQEAPVFDLQGTDSESNAIVMGGHVLPAMPDDRFRNRPPRYPLEAQMLGQYGEVVVVIHVSETGLAAGADVTRSSGVNVLDEAALMAVRKWHFHPALKDGQPVPFDMPFRFIFEAN